ncbi:hypothetical protein [Chloroflexus sp.]|uniref:hypothetical protein n=1 Tax=Chloroflexus sp. TaxID=1904827 RepID=UPI002621298D|nr:hypothetical protein [uncultured Chloroflexus sp.]
MLLPLEEAYWQTVQRRLGVLVVDLPAALRLPALNLLDNEFHRLLALWPRWLADLLPLPKPGLTHLTLAALAGGWAASLDDAARDGELPGLFRSLRRALWRQAWRLFARLGLALPPLLTLSTQMTIACRHELAARAVHGRWHARQLQTLTTRWVRARAAGWHAIQLAQMELTGLAPTDCRRRDLARALDLIILARQLRDDAVDLTADAQAGRATWLIALIAATIWQTDGYPGTVDSARITGRWLLDENLRRQVAQLHATLCARAAVALAPYQPRLPRLFDLIAAEQQAGQAAFASYQSLQFGLPIPPTGDAFGQIDTCVERSASVS